MKIFYGNNFFSKLFPIGGVMDFFNSLKTTDGGILSGIIWLVVAILVVVIFAIYFYDFIVYGDYLTKLSHNKKKNVCLITKIICWSVSVLVILSPLFYNYFSTTATVIVKNNGQLEVHPHGNVFCWEWGNNFCVDNDTHRGHEIISPPTLTCSKASNLTYSLWVSVNNIEKFYQSLNALQKKNLIFPIFKSSGYIGVVDEIVNYNLYEFNQAHADDFVGFFNPIDIQQQETFKRLVRENLTAKLARNGIIINDVSFSLQRPVYRQ